MGTLGQSEGEEIWSQGKAENVRCREGEDFGRSETTVEGRKSGWEVETLTLVRLRRGKFVLAGSNDTL